MKTSFAFAVVFVLGISFAHAQEEGRAKGLGGNGNTSFYAELGGPGILFSANLDKRFTASHLGLGGRIGVGFVTIFEQKTIGTNTDYRNVSVATFPIQLNYIFGKPASPHTFEVGAGVTIAGREIEVLDFYDESKASAFGTASFMYRRQPAGGGFTWRIGFTPIFAKGYIQPFGGAGVGYNF
jgi:hypothetical protein